MQRLLYHAPDNPSQESPFDRAILQVVQGQEASIVSPYIGLQYLQRLIRLSRSWRLISEVLEWLSATPPKERSAVYEFLKENEGLVHHYPAIHAKTVVSQVGAYTGSANLTDAGVLRRTEFGVLLTDAGQIREVQHWFDAIWAQTSPPALKSVLEVIGELNLIPHFAAEFVEVKATSLESDALRVRARLVKILGHEPQTVTARHTQTSPTVSPEALPKVQAPSQAPVTNPATPSPASPALPPRPMAAPARVFDLEEEIDAYVTANALGGFSFVELHKAMRHKLPALTMRETYLSILESCASHPRALFWPDAKNRLVYSDRRFVQSNRELLTRALNPLDEMVSQIIEGLLFGDATTSQADLESQIAPLGVLRVLLEGMIRAGFVAQQDAGLQLVPSAAWSPRLRLLERAHAKWTSRLNALSTKRSPEVTAQALLPQAAVNPLQATAGRLGIEHSDDDGQSQQKLIERRSAQMDTVFSHLAEIRALQGEKTKIGLSYLKDQLTAKTGLNEGDVSRLINGTYPMYRSPFLALVTEARGTVSIVADLEANPHLGALEATRAAIKKYKVLQELEIPARPLQIPQKGDGAPKAVNVRIDRLKEVDEAYLLIAHWIFQSQTAAYPMKERRLLMLLSASGLSPETLRRLLLDTSFHLPKLFSLKSEAVRKRPHTKGALSLRLNHDKLVHYPNTHAYLKSVVWPSDTQHSWLPAHSKARAEAIENFELATINLHKSKPSERDKQYARLLSFIDKRIRHFDRFKSSDALVSALSASGIERFLIEFLLGIGHKPPTQLMRVEKDTYGLFLQISPEALTSYPVSRKLIEKPVPEGSYRPPWLTAHAYIAATQAPPAPPANLAPSRIAPPAFAALRWDDGNRFEMDTLYVALARLFVERPPLEQQSPDEARRVRSESAELYLKISDYRKASGNTHKPVLSLEFHGGANDLVELVIYRGYRDYIHQYPKLHRYLASTPMKLREV